MAKTLLVGLYDTFTDAQQVVQELEKSGFSRSRISLATHSAGDVKNQHVDYVYTEKKPSTDQGRKLINLLTDYGVPQHEVDSYAEGVRRGGALVLVKATEVETERGLAIMKQLRPVDIDQRLDKWRQEGWNRFDPDAEPYAVADVTRERERYGQHMTDEGEVTIPVVEEELTVGKREVERERIRIHTYVEEQPVAEDVRLREERVTVERHPVNRPATEADLDTFREETMEFTETAEEAVVSRRARVVEEVTVQKDVAERTEMVHDTVRRTHVDVDHEAIPTATNQRAFETYDTDFRRHYDATFASSGGAYNDYEPAYRYGYSLGYDERYRDRDWATVEADARRDWEARHQGTWERFKDAIRHGWTQVRA
jgi:uncharacterized protein (TIGR02271 family)